MKKVLRFKINEDIPNDAKYLCSKFCNVNQVMFLYYEVKSSKKDSDLIENQEDITRIINYLNKKTNGKFSDKSKSAVKLINLRFKEGAKAEDFKKVIDNMCLVWLHDPDMRMYLRPETLFNGKFFGYLSMSSDNQPKDGFRDLELLNQKILSENTGNV